MPTKCSKCHALCRRKCGACRSVYYCSVECQRADRPLHKLDCNDLFVFTTINMALAYFYLPFSITIQNISTMADGPFTYREAWESIANGLAKLQGQGGFDAQSGRLNFSLRYSEPGHCDVLIISNHVSGMVLWTPIEEQ